MIQWCAFFSLACLLVLIYLDDTYNLCRPWLAQLGMLLGLLGLAIALGGCAATEHIRLDQSPQEAATQAVCQPLPVCEIPPAASANQLTAALWACVLEYRALYSQCYHLAHPPQASNLPPCDHRTTWPRRIPRARCGNV